MSDILSADYVYVDRMTTNYNGYTSNNINNINNNNTNEYSEYDIPILSPTTNSSSSSINNYPQTPTTTFFNNDYQLSIDSNSNMITPLASPFENRQLYYNNNGYFNEPLSAPPSITTFDNVQYTFVNQQQHQLQEAAPIINTITSNGNNNNNMIISSNGSGKRKKSASRKGSTAPPGPIPATTPTLVRRDEQGVEWIAFEYSKERIKTSYCIRCDIETVDVSRLDDEFKVENCIYPRATVPPEQYTGNRQKYETECNCIGWCLSFLNPALRGQRGLIQRAVDSWRNTNADPSYRSRRVRRQSKKQNQLQKLSIDKRSKSFATIDDLSITINNDNNNPHHLLHSKSFSSLNQHVKLDYPTEFTNPTPFINPFAYTTNTTNNNSIQSIPAPLGPLDSSPKSNNGRRKSSLAIQGRRNSSAIVPY
jgi:hypothetical protein